MELSRYPRYGHWLAPSLLRDMLQASLPKFAHAEPSLRLCDLDATAWDRFSVKECERLGAEIVKQIRMAWIKMPAKVKKQRLRIPKAFVLEDLELETRTINCLNELRARRKLKTVKDWAAIRIGDLYDIRAFGARGLVDFLTLVESTAAGPIAVRAGPPPVVPTSLQEELVALMKGGGAMHKRNKRIVVRYYGLDGKGAPFLETVAAEFGISHQRVRQICLRAAKPLSRKELTLPFFDRTIELIARKIPTTASDVEARLIAEGLTRSRFRVEAIPKIAKLVGRELSFAIREENGAITSGVLSEPLLAARRIVEVVLRELGLATTADVIARCERDPPSDISVQELLRLLPTIPHFAWLDEPTGWFWMNWGRNRAADAIRKVLEAVGKIDIAELRAQIIRRYHHAPPSHILLEFCRQLPGCKVVGTSIRAVTPIVWESALTGIEETVVRVLKERGKPMTRQKLTDACARRGAHPPTFSVFLSGTPVVVRYGHAIYGLPGAHPRPGEIESLLPKSQRAMKVRVDHG